MSLVFLKSADDKQDGRYNPNKPYRFSNYLTNPITIPKNAQVAYVSSQFSIDGNGIPPDEPSWAETGENEVEVFEMPVQYRWISTEARTTGGWESIMNSWPLSANEFGMDGDISPAKYVPVSGDSDVPQANYGYRAAYDETNNTCSITTAIRPALDQFNLYFNCLRTNPSYLTTGWASGPGATVPAGLNFTDKVDSKFQTDCLLRSRNSPSGNTSFLGGNCFGYLVGAETNNGNARPRVYAGGANYYNTGFATTGLDGNGGLYQFGGPQGAAAPIMPFDEGRYACVMGTTGLKKSVGDITPSNNAQQSNGGGHQQIGHLESGGYFVFTNTNLDQIVANAQYTIPVSTKEGFTGLAPQFMGLHSIPYVSQRGFDEAIKNGSSVEDAKQLDNQIDNFLKLVDLNNSTSATTAEGADARYLIGVELLNEGAPPDVDLVARVKVLDTIAGSITNSKYREIGTGDIGNHPGLSIRALSQGTNTACIPPFEFAASADYSINTYNTTPGRTPASLFFRMRWVNKNQINVEFTLSVDGFAGTYNNATDEPYAPAPEYADPPDADTADPRNKWCLLASMSVTDIQGDLEYFIPTFMGDMGYVHYPIAASPDAREFRALVKGYFDPKLTNRTFKNNNNGGGRQYAPYSSENPYFSGFDSLGTLIYNKGSKLTDPTKTSQTLINAGYDGTEPTSFNSIGMLEGEKKWLGSAINYPYGTSAYRKINGFPAWLPNQPRIELAYVFGFLQRSDVPNPVVLPVNTIIAPIGSTNILAGANEINATNEAFSSHIQLTNLPIQSSNGVVSSVCKTIYIVNTLCASNVHDDSDYRYYCHTAPVPLWIDLNNLEEIQLNKIDVLVTQDNNTEQKNLNGESDIVIMFRSKSEGTLPNAIPYQSISTTRTY